MSTTRSTSGAEVASNPLARGRGTAILHAALLVLAPLEIATAILIVADVPVAVWIPVIIGGLLVTTVAAEVVLATRVFLRARRAGSPRREVARTLVRESVPAPMVRFARFEILLWVSAARWVARRPLVPAGGRGFTFHCHERPILLAFAGLGLVEIALVHWLLPWPVAQIIALVLGVMGVLWVLGFLASLSTRPHYVTDGTLAVRVDAHTMIHLDRSRIATATPALNHSTEDGVRIGRSPDGEGEAVSIVRHGQTNVSVSLEHGTALDVPGHGVLNIKRLSFWVDGAEALCALLQRNSHSITGSGT
ncbi:hypothetical protein [Brevibacterium yomogidense]|uniref:Membrane protein, putative n=1 Tax=Brevibacterium yomogidense TaxID=946573 RepID=A0A1X6XJ61_9MICO|nr:hypothetical protein [Brevibacterium yomogidense]SLM99322.1 membrane protein, putative [Brevibacterium yomogidense]